MKHTLFFGVVLSLLLVGCGKDDVASSASTSANGAETTKVLRIGTESGFKPFSYLDNQGNLVGFEIDLANAMCEKMQVRCEITSHDWDGLIPSLQANRFDAIMAGMSVTDERKQAVAFSEPYFVNKLVLVAKKGDNLGLKDTDGKTVAVQLATLSGQYLKQHQPNAIIKEYDKQDNAYLDLSAGRVEFMMSDIVPMMDWLKTDNGQNFEIKGEPIDINDTVAVALRKDDAATLESVNAALAALKSSGEYDKIVAKYFDVSALGQ